MAVFRIERTRDYTVMSNHHLRNGKLSLKAKGLLSMMLSLPEDWNYTTRGLAKICKEGVDAIGGALRELEKAEADLAGGLHVFAGPLSGHPAQNPDGEVWSIGEGEFFPESDLSQEDGLSAPQFCYVIDGITEE